MLSHILSTEAVNHWLGLDFHRLRWTSAPCWWKAGAEIPIPGGLKLLQTRVCAPVLAPLCGRPQPNSEFVVSHVMTVT